MEALAALPYTKMELLPPRVLRDDEPASVASLSLKYLHRRVLAIVTGMRCHVMCSQWWAKADVSEEVFLVAVTRCSRMFHTELPHASGRRGHVK
eukprot:6017975-Amphidinium_carterae.1